VTLDEYRRKRRFGKTPEPPGRSRRRRRKNVFVVQKHDASRLHYDFRLEIDGALASWAVPKGPSMSATEKRLAVRTEDHPLDYGEFEGTIPEGEYGAGTVMLWDRGEFLPGPDDPLPPAEQLERGELKFVLLGEKLEGGFVLVRTRWQGSGRGRKEQWLLLKRRDPYAVESWDVEAPALDRSVLSGRTLEQIAAGRVRSARRRAPPPASTRSSG
jgi:bifunctional non-homologous end joining protein LigD